MSDAYRFDNEWHLAAPLERVYAALADIERYQDWWPQVRKTQRLDTATGRVRVRSLLPYSLDLVLARDVEDEAGGILRVDLTGDLCGWCAWHLTPEGTGTRALFTQEVQVEAPLLQRVPLAVRPLLRGNHAFMMRSGERGLRRYLA